MAMTKATLEAQIAKLEAELHAARSGANINPEAEPLGYEAGSMLGMLGINWKTFAAKAVVGFGYGYLVSTLLNATLGIVGIATWPVLVAVFAHVMAIALSIYFILMTAGVVTDFIVDELPAHARSAYSTATKWLGNAAATTKEFATEQYGRVVH